MPNFTYKGVAAGGKAVSGSLDAADRKQALGKLRVQGITPLEVALASGSGSQSAEGGAGGGLGAGGSATRSAASARASSAASASAASAASAALPPVQAADVAGAPDIFVESSSAAGGGLSARFGSRRDLALPFLLKFRQLHGSGMSLGEVLQVMSNRMSDVRLKDLSQDLYRDLSEGRTLAAAVKARPDVFEPTMSYLIEAGEATGNLMPILSNIIEHLQAKRELGRKVKAALAYPALITSMALAVVGIFLFFLVPRIESMLDSMGTEMGFTARVMVGMSEFAVHQGPVVLGILLLLGFVLLRWRKTPKGRRLTDVWLLRLPLVRSITYNAEIVRSTNVLAILLGSGVNTTESLRLAENTLQNTVVRSRFSAARHNINDGAGFAAAFKRFGLFPDLDIDILNVGESTGSLVGSFEELYRSHAEELTAKLFFVTKLISGVVLAFAFCMIFILTLSIVLSVMDVSRSMLT